MTAGTYPCTLHRLQGRRGGWHGRCDSFDSEEVLFCDVACDIFLSFFPLQIHYGEVDFVKYLPLFFEGICEKREPLKFLAHEGTQQLLEYASPASLLKALPAVMRAIYTAFETNDKEVICTILKSIQKLVLSHPEVGPELVRACPTDMPSRRCSYQICVSPGSILQTFIARDAFIR